MSSATRRAPRPWLAGLLLGVGAAGVALGTPVGRSDPAAGPAAAGPADVRRIEHRYRIVGKVRLGFWWAGGEVGGARWTYAAVPGGTAISLLAGSDPDRAPRRLNQWTYLREEVRHGEAEIFSLRSIDAGTPASATPLSLGRGPTFAVSCGSISGTGADAVGTTVEAPGVTYRMVDDLLGRLPGRKWTRQSAPATDAYPGFLTALDALLARERSPGASAVGPLAYVYNGGVYSLEVKKRRLLRDAAVGDQRYAQLARADFLIRNQRTRDESTFTMAYVPAADAAPVPVQIAFQPNFWLHVELRLDGSASVPDEPAADAGTLARMRAICASAAGPRAR
jgi:hypothetical protein